jgi:hypothetical protein
MSPPSNALQGQHDSDAQWQKKGGFDAFAKAVAALCTAVNLKSNDSDLRMRWPKRSNVRAGSTSRFKKHVNVAPHPSH